MEQAMTGDYGPWPSAPVLLAEIDDALADAIHCLGRALELVEGDPGSGYSLSTWQLRNAVHIRASMAQLDYMRAALRRDRYR